MWKNKWKLFHATNFQSLMYPCFTFCRIFGMFPYKINASTFEISKSHYLISTVIVCMCCVFDVILTYDVNISKLHFVDIVMTFDFICYNTFSCFIVTITHILSGPRMRLLQIILEISSKLPPKSYQKLSRLIHAKDILGTIFLIVQICIYLFKMENHPITVIMAFEIYLYITVFELNMLYINCVCVLKACFKSINDNLTHMQILMTNDMKSCGPRLIRHVQRNEFWIIKLKSLKKWHLMISDAVKMLNIIFSLQLVTVIVMSYCNSTFQIYYYVVRWQDGIFIIFDTYFSYAILTALGYYALNITLIVWACETGKNQVQEIKTTIHDVLNSTNNEKIKNEVIVLVNFKGVILFILFRKCTFIRDFFKFIRIYF